MLYTKVEKSLLYCGPKNNKVIFSSKTVLCGTYSDFTVQLKAKHCTGQGACSFL